MTDVTDMVRDTVGLRHRSEEEFPPHIITTIIIINTNNRSNIQSATVLPVEDSFRTEEDTTHGQCLRARERSMAIHPMYIIQLCLQAALALGATVVAAAAGKKRHPSLTMDFEGPERVPDRLEEPKYPAKIRVPKKPPFSVANL